MARVAANTYLHVPTIDIKSWKFPVQKNDDIYAYNVVVVPPI